MRSKNPSLSIQRETAAGPAAERRMTGASKPPASPYPVNHQQLGDHREGDPNARGAVSPLGGRSNRDEILRGGGSSGPLTRKPIKR